MTNLDWNFQLAEQLDFYWREQLRPRLNGLTDEEYRWEPVPGMWSVRPREMLHHGAEIALLRDLYRWQFDGKGA
jgi:hypothetical protein